MEKKLLNHELIENFILKSVNLAIGSRLHESFRQKIVEFEIV